MGLKKSIKNILLKTLWKYDNKKLSQVLNSAGIKQGDSVMLHATWRADNGFTGSAKDFNDTFKTAVSSKGNVIMMSMPYHNQSTKAYLSEQKLFKLRRSPSMVGLLSEVFRRGKDVVRSLNAAHPFLVWGKDKEWLIEGHEKATCSFGQGSPFDKLLALNCKILLVDTPFNSITYNHYLEDLHSDKFPVALYDEETMSGRMLDSDGEEVTFSTPVLSKLSNPYRIDDLLENALNKQGKIQRFRVGNTHFTLVKVSDLVDVAKTSIIF